MEIALSTVQNTGKEEFEECLTLKLLACGITTGAVQTDMDTGERRRDRQARERRETQTARQTGHTDPDRYSDPDRQTQTHTVDPSKHSSACTRARTHTHTHTHYHPQYTLERGKNRGSCLHSFVIWSFVFIQHGRPHQ